MKDKSNQPATRSELKTELTEFEARIDTKIETTVNTVVTDAVKQILSAFDMKIDQVRSDMTFADEHQSLKTRVKNLEQSVFG